MLNVVFLICCLPIVTIGASLTALHYVTLKMARNEESYISEASSNPLRQELQTGNCHQSYHALQLQLSFTWISSLAYCRQYRRNNVRYCISFSLHLVSFIWWYFCIYLSGACQILQLHQNTFRNTYSWWLLSVIFRITLIWWQSSLCYLQACFIKSFAYSPWPSCFCACLDLHWRYDNGHFLVKIFDNYIPADTDTQDRPSERKLCWNFISRNDHSMTKWEKPYHSLDYMLRERFGEKVYKVTLNGGMSCPTETVDWNRGCRFCSAGGSGDFAADAALSSLTR